MNNYQILKYRFIRIVVDSIRFFYPENKEVRSFFILGSGRNGSTLLASILNAHKNIFIPPEQFVLPYAIILKYIYFFLPNSFWSQKVVSMFKASNKTLNWKLDWTHLNINARNIATLFNSIYIHYSKKYKKDDCIWGDKTPLNIHFLYFIYPEFKSSKYIFMIRDPRDVVLSYKKLHKHRASQTKYAILKWKDSIAKLRYLQRNTDVIIVRYEDLVNNTEIEIQKIITHLSVEKEENLIRRKNNASSMGVEQKLHHQNLNKPINTNSIGKWKDGLTKQEISVINNSCSKYYEEFGYSV